MKIYPHTHRYIRKNNKGKNFYYIRFSQNGRDIRRSLGPDKFVADILAKELEHQLLHKKLKLPSRAKTTVQDWVENYMNFSKKEKAESTFRADGMRLKRFINFLSETKIGYVQDIDFKILDEFKSEIAEKVSRKSANNLFSLIKTMMKYALNMGMIEDDISKKIKLYRNVPKRFPRVLSPEEIELVLGVADPVMRKAILFLLYTGMRSAEFINCQWQDVEMDKELIRVECKDGFHTKSYKPRSIYFVQGLKEVILEIPKRATYLFDTGAGKPLFTQQSLYGRFKKICRNCGVKGVNIHSLRHTHATYLLEAGIEPVMVQEDMGHQDIKTTMMYCHLLPKNVKKRIKDVSFPCAKFVPSFSIQI